MTAVVALRRHFSAPGVERNAGDVYDALQARLLVEKGFVRIATPEDFERKSDDVTNRMMSTESKPRSKTSSGKGKKYSRSDVKTS